MVEVVIIIGNGFDKDLGLPTGYPDFVKSDEWKKLEKKFCSFTTEDDLTHSLIYHLQTEAYNKENWFDIEEEIQQFIKNHPKCKDEEIREIENEFIHLKKALKDYLIRVSSGYKMEEARLPYELLKKLSASPKRIVVINFNYTNPHDFLSTPIYCRPSLYEQTHVHGSLFDDDIVLGCDVPKDQEVNRDLSFMYKYNMLKRANHVARNLLEAKEIIFYGHSVNEMDFGYFREFFKKASEAPKPTRYLTFITLNEKSERRIKDNIRNQGIPVTDLYNNLESFTFIHTKKLYEQDINEVQMKEDLFKRIMIKDHRGINIRN